jgi:hypothetical protein
MCSDAEDVDGVALVVEREDGVLVDVVGGDDGEAGEPVDVEGLRDADEGLARYFRQVGLEMI